VHGGLPHRPGYAVVPQFEPGVVRRAVALRGMRSRRGREPDESFRSGTSRPRSCALARFRVLARKTLALTRRFRGGGPAAAEVADAAPATSLRPEGAVLREGAALPRLSGRDSALVGSLVAALLGRAEHRRARRRPSPIRPARSAFAGIDLAPLLLPRESRALRSDRSRRSAPRAGPLRNWR